jgi:hypothetical protein
MLTLSASSFVVFHSVVTAFRIAVRSAVARAAS